MERTCIAEETFLDLVGNSCYYYSFVNPQQVCRYDQASLGDVRDPYGELDSICDFTGKRMCLVSLNTQL